MIWTLLIGVGSFVIFWTLLRPNSKVIAGVYRQPGRFYYLKKLIFLLLFKIRQYKNQQKPSQNVLDKNRGYGSGAKDIKKLESVCTLDRDEYALDAVYFGGFNKDGARCVLRIGRRHGRHAEIWLFLEIPGIGCLQHPVHPDTDIHNTNPNEFSAGGIKIEMIEPMRKWKISFNGQLRHGLCNDLSNKPEVYLQTKFSFIWTAISDPFNFDTDISPTAIADAIAREEWTKEFWGRLKSKHQTHYEQWGELRGKLEVEGHEEMQLHLKTVRDHSLGVRDWKSFHKYAIHFIFLENGTTIQTGIVSLPATTSHLQLGYLVYPSGDMLPVSNVDLKLWEVAEGDEPANEYYFSFVSGGKEFLVEVTGETTPIWYHHSDRRTRIYEKFCKYIVNGKKGFGLVEFCYRNEDGPAYEPKESTLLLQEPSTDEISTVTTHLTVKFDNKGCFSSKLVGGKGAQLGMLTSIQNQVGATVPKGFCVTLTAFTTQLNNSQDLRLALDKIENVIRTNTLDQLQSVCSDAVELFASCSVCEPVETAVWSIITDMFGADGFTLAVRSSAAGEDGSEASSAGQMETYLGVKDQKEIFDSIRKCWASAFTYQAVEYRRQHGQPVRVAVGVVIQEMVRSEVSGVLFTCDPVTGSPNLMTMDAAYGLGESVVSGKTNPDTIKVSRTWDDQISIKDKQIGDKKVILSVSSESSGIQETVNEESVTCCLSDEDILNLCEICIKVEHHFGSPRDLEWAYAGGQFYLLQARPITTLEQETDEDLIHEFDNSLVSDREVLTLGNIGEMMPGAVTPLTGSLFKLAVDGGMKSYTNIAAGAYRLKYADRILYTFCNRLFINMNHIDIIGIHNIHGKKEAAELSVLGESLDYLTVEDVKEYAGQHKTLLNRLWIFFKYIFKSRKKIKIIESWYDRLKTYSVGSGVDDACSLYKEINEKLPDYNEIWETTIVKSADSGIWAGAVVGIISEGKNAWTTENCADVALLLSQCDEVYSAEVPSAVQDLAKEILNVKAVEEFKSAEEKDCMILLTTDKYPSLQRKYNEFMDRHGHRCVREAELIERSWKVQPEKLVRVLKTMLQTKSFEKKEKQVLTKEESIKKIKSPLNWFARFMLKLILPRARKAVGQREWGKSVAVKLADVFKEAYWKLADLMVKEGRLPDKELLFYLTNSEIEKLLQNRAPRLITKAIKRRKLLPKSMELKYPKLSIGIPKPIIIEDIQSQRKSNFCLKGMPVCQGIITGTARVVQNLEEANLIKNGDILIVSYTDVGWSPYFPLISGLVTEIGGLLSHGAVVAREYGVPCIVSVNNATQMFMSGDTVRLDGLSGTISKLDN